MNGDGTCLRRIEFRSSCCCCCFGIECDQMSVQKIERQPACIFSERVECAPWSYGKKLNKSNVLIYFLVVVDRVRVRERISACKNQVIAIYCPKHSWKAYGTMALLSLFFSFIEPVMDIISCIVLVSHLTEDQVWSVHTKFWTSNITKCCNRVQCFFFFWFCQFCHCQFQHYFSNLCICFTRIEQSLCTNKHPI